MRPIHTITEGGQLSIHSLRMLKQVFKLSCLTGLTIWMTLFVFAMLFLPNYLYQSIWYYLVAIYSQAMKIEYIMIDREFWRQVTGRVLRANENVTPDQVIYFTKPYFNHFKHLGLDNLIFTGLIAAFAFALIILFFYVRGKISAKKKHISGNIILPAWRVALNLKLTGNASKVRIGKFPLVKGTETQHILITGGTGSGKTNCFHHLLPQIRNQMQRAVIIDTTGAFVDRYYRQNQDIILNPFDVRSSSWHPWIECRDNFDYEALAESFIPQSYSDHEKYWNTAARSLFSSVLFKLKNSRKTSELNQWLLYESLSRLSAFVKGTKAASHIDINSERTASSVRSVASAHLESLEFITDTETPFSIRDWMHNGSEGSWLFLTAKPSQRSALNPLLSCWFSVAMRSLLHLEPDLHRRIWFIIDELPSLHRLKDLEFFLSEGRKYGGCALLALQSPSQLEALYGPEITRTIIGNCGTKVIFSEQDPEIAAKISKAFGEREIKEYQKGLSYGANDVRDGVNLTLQTRQQQLISPSEIQFLKKNEAFVRLPGNYPITQIKLPIAKT